MAAWNGPALYCYDDASFRQEDFVSIQNVANGKKRGDPTKTGQFGLGFNSVYHITDTPIFLTGKVRDTPQQSPLTCTHAHNT
jgi:hypothetical protein